MYFFRYGKNVSSFSDYSRAVAATPAEEVILSLAPSGRTIDVSIHGEPIWKHLVRTDFLRALLTGQLRSDPGNTAIAVASTLQIENVWLIGPLDLSDCGGIGKDLPHVSLRHCTFHRGAVLDRATMGGLTIEDSVFLRGGISANGARFKNGVKITKTRITRPGFLEFNQARVEGDLVFSDLQGLVPPRRLQEFRRFFDKCWTAYQDAPMGDTIASWVKESKFLGPTAAEEFARAVSAFGDRSGLIAGVTSGNSSVHGLSHMALKSVHVKGALTFEGFSTCRCKDCATINEKSQGVHAVTFSTVPPSRAAIDLEQADIEGDLNVRKVEDVPLSIDGTVKLSYAKVGGSVSFGGAFIAQRDGSPAIRADGIKITGDFELSPTNSTVSTICKLIGSLQLIGSQIGGQLQISGAEIDGGPEALVADGAEIGSDVFVSVSSDSAHRSLLTGIVRFSGATIGGQLGFLGSLISQPDPKERAVELHDATVKGGLYLRAVRLAPMEIKGEFRLSDCWIGSTLEISGTHLDAGDRDIALKADGCVVKGDVHIGRLPPKPYRTGLYEECFIKGTIRMAGAEIGGRFTLAGGKVSSKDRAGAIVLSGAHIKRGVFLRPSECQTCTQPVMSEIDGTLRLNNAQIGSKFKLEGAKLTATRDVGIALWANGTVFGGNVTLAPSDQGTPFIVEGEIRMYGARVDGELNVQTGSLIASTTEFAMDCYNAEISKGVLLIPNEANNTAAPNTLRMDGIVGFAYTRLGQLIVGRTFADQQQATGASVTLNGHLRIPGAKIASLTSLVNVEMAPPVCCGEDRCERILKTLGQWQPSDRRTIVDAENADLGAVLNVNLSLQTKGAIKLVGAHVATLDDRKTLGWGEVPKGPGWSGRGDAYFEGVRLLLNGFSYDHLHEPEKKLPHSHNVWHRLWCFALDSWNWIRPDRTRLNARLKWINRQYPNGIITPEEFVPAPYIQLSNVFRTHGYSLEADLVSYERRKCHALHGTIGRLDRLLEWLYAGFFGFGYRSGRALLTLVLLFAINSLIVYRGVQNDWLKQTSSITAVTSPASDSAPFPTPQKSAYPMSAIASSPASDVAAPACNAWITYSLQQTFPVLQTSGESGCSIRESKAPSWYQPGRLLMRSLGWVVLAAAALTFSGILRETNK